MTELLAKAFAEASKLPDFEQDLLAKAMLHDLGVKEKFDKEKRPQFASARDSIRMSNDFDED